MNYTFVSNDWATPGDPYVCASWNHLNFPDNATKYKKSENKSLKSINFFN